MRSSCPPGHARTDKPNRPAFTVERKIKPQVELPPAHIAASANSLRLCDTVEVAQAPEGPAWLADWVGTTGEVVGIVSSHTEVNVTIRHDNDQRTDGFKPEDFRVIGRRATAFSSH